MAERRIKVRTAGAHVPFKSWPARPGLAFHGRVGGRIIDPHDAFWARYDTSGRVLDRVIARSWLRTRMLQTTDRIIRTNRIIRQHRDRRNDESHWGRLALSRFAMPARVDSLSEYPSQGPGGPGRDRRCRGGGGASDCVSDLDAPQGCTYRWTTRYRYWGLTGTGSV